MQNRIIMPAFALLLLLQGHSYAAARNKTKIPDPPPEAKIIPWSIFQAELKNGNLIPLPAQSPLSDKHLSTTFLHPSVQDFKEDFEARLPEKKDLITLDLPATHQIPVPLASGKFQSVTLMGGDFAAATLAQTIQTRTSPFNENLITLQTAQFAELASDMLLTEAIEPIQPPPCSKEIGYKHGWDLGKGTPSPSPLGLYSQFSWPLKPFVTCVKDQGQRGSCTAFATSSAIESVVANQNHLWINLSEQALYNESKMLWSPDYTPSAPSLPNAQADGFVTSDLLNEAKKNSYLFPLEFAWEYNRSEKIQIVASKTDPSKTLITHACDGYTDICSNTIHQGNFVCAQLTDQYQCGYLTPVTQAQKGAKIKDYVELWNLSDPTGSLNLMVTYLGAGQPLIASMAVTLRFLTIKNGFADAPETHPDPNHPDTILGYHAVSVVGYLSRAEILAKLPRAPLNTPKSSPDQPTSGYFIVKNQWGNQWGDSGYVYLPGDYLIKNLLAVQALAGVDLVGLSPQ